MVLLATSSFNWEQFAAAWGPAIPMFMALMYYLHRLVFRVIPRGFNMQRRTIKAENRKAARRHREAMDLLRGLEKALEETPPPRRVPALRKRVKR